MAKQAEAELGQAQLKLELSFTWFKICYIKLSGKTKYNNIFNFFSFVLFAS